MKSKIIKNFHRIKTHPNHWLRFSFGITLIIGGIIGPFCLETIVDDKLEFKVFEVSARIVAGTNPFTAGSPYSELLAPDLSTGRRIAQEIKLARELNKLGEVLS